MHEMHVESRSWHVIVLDFALFCGFTLREFKLPECHSIFSCEIRLLQR